MISDPNDQHPDILDLTDPEWVRRWVETQQLPPESVPTPLPTLNSNSRGAGGGEGPAFGWFITLGGNPGHGKTLVALNFAAAAMESGIATGLVSLEMAPGEIATRMYAIATGEPVDRLERGSRFSLTVSKEAARWAARSRADGQGFFVNADPLPALVHVVDAMDAMRDRGCRLVVVDYLQLVSAGNDDDVYRAVVEVATTLRLWAHQHRVLVVGLSQYNRRTSADYDQSPMPQSLHGGMALEANSHQCWLLDHSRFERDVFHRFIARTFLLQAKNRHGPTASIPVEWDYRTLRLREALEDEVHRWPGESS